MEQNSTIPDEPTKVKFHTNSTKGQDADIPPSAVSVSENGIASSESNDHDGKDICNIKNQDTLQAGDVDESEKAQSNGEIFSPDLSENVVTVISSQAKAGDSESWADQEGCDDYDTHSDSIETLEEDSPHDVSQEKLCDSLLQQIRLTDNSGGEKEGEPNHVNGKASMPPLGDRLAADDAASTDSHEVIADTAGPTGAAAARPESLSLPRSLQYLEKKRSASDSRRPDSGPFNKGEGPGHQRTRSEAIDIQGVRVKGDLGYGDDIMSKSLPHGTIMRKGDLIEFVADDLQEKIKRSSPMSRADSGSMGSRRSSERSLASTSSATSASTSMATSSGLSRSPSSLLTQSPDAAPPIDPAAIIELEMSARRVADSVDLMMGNIRSNLHKMSAITVGCLQAYKTSVDITCDSVDSSIKSMYALMAKCEELNKTMQPVHQIGAQIKEIKRLLDLFEAQLSEKT